LKKRISKLEHTPVQKTAVSNYCNKYQSPEQVTTNESRRNSMKKNILKISVFALILFLGLMMVVVYGQAPPAEPLAEGVVAESEIGPSGVGDDPGGGMKILYMFTGVHNKESDPEYVTVVHCTNIGSSSVSVQVQFFASVGGIPATASAAVASDSTKTFSSQSILSWPHEVAAYTGGEDIQHGSGRVLVPDNPDVNVICTIQVLALNSSDVPTDMTKLHLFDSEGNLIDDDPKSDQDGIFMPIIFKNG
jgi:hypothetical protein